MKPNITAMKCPNCGDEMNHHADKIDYTGAMKDPGNADPVPGGVIEEFHSCPRCGTSASRPVSRPDK